MTTPTAILAEPVQVSGVTNTGRGLFSLAEVGQAGDWKPYKPSNSGILIHTCREQFHAVWTDNRRILFYHAPTDPEKAVHLGLSFKVAAVLARVEKQLIGKSRRSVVFPTTRRDVTAISVSKWWLDQEIRKSFLTILLRAALRYEFHDPSGSYELVLKEGDTAGYFKRTQPAVERFMSGYTKFHDQKKKPSWFMTFYDGSTCTPRTAKEVKKLLV